MTPAEAEAPVQRGRLVHPHFAGKLFFLLRHPNLQRAHFPHMKTGESIPQVIRTEFLGDPQVHGFPKTRADKRPRAAAGRTDLCAGAGAW